MTKIVLAHDQKHAPGHYFSVGPNASPKRTPAFKSDWPLAYTETTLAPVLPKTLTRGAYNTIFAKFSTKGISMHCKKPQHFRQQWYWTMSVSGIERTNWTKE